MADGRALKRDKPRGPRAGDWTLRRMLDYKIDAAARTACDAIRASRACRELGGDTALERFLNRLMDELHSTPAASSSPPPG